MLPLPAVPGLLVPRLLARQKDQEVPRLAVNTRGRWGGGEAFESLPWLSGYKQLPAFELRPEEGIDH